MTRVSVVVLAALALGAGGPALAQPLTREDLEAALKQRDQEIAALEKRIAALEAAREGGPMATARGSPTAPTVQTASAQASDRPTAAAAASVGDEEAALQALSRGLVQRGLVLLPTWSVEATPSLTYSHSQIQGLALVDTPQGFSVVDSQRQRDDEAEGAVSVRVGLPWRSQLQVSVPFDWKREASALGDGTLVTHSATHVGDVSLELSHQFLVENGWRPDLIGAVAWRAPTGLDPYKAPIASVANSIGTNEITARATTLKSIDPLVVFSTVSYAANLPYRERFGRVHVGDTVDWNVGALLAVSPDTSISFGFDQQFKTVTRVDGAKIPGSDGVAATAQIGLDQVLNAHTLLDVSLGIGVTRDAPDYTFMVSLPYRFR